MYQEVNSRVEALSKSLGLTHKEQKEEALKDIPQLTELCDCALLCGDNLLYLKALLRNYNNKIGFCYIDPPYNSGNKFIYDDNRKSQNNGPFGRHAEWMSFMLPRLVLAHKLLHSDAAIAISIDDHEFTYLKILMDHIFGEDNFIGNIVVNRSTNGKGSKKNIAPCHEYLLVYGKTSKVRLRGEKNHVSDYPKHDKYGHYRIDGMLRKKGDGSLKKDRPNLYYPLYIDGHGQVFTENADGLITIYPKDSRGVDRRWIWSKKTTAERLWQLHGTANGTVYIKTYLNSSNRKKIRTIWAEKGYLTSAATNEIKKIFGAKIFDTPKPSAFIKNIVDTMSEPDTIILDFFAGSGTTADAVNQLNQIDSGKRKTILIESNSMIPLNHISHDMSTRVISDITEKRLKYISNRDEDFKYTTYRY